MTSSAPDYRGIQQFKGNSSLMQIRGLVNVVVVLIASVTAARRVRSGQR